MFCEVKAMWKERRKSILNIKENLFSPENGTLYKDVHAYHEVMSSERPRIFTYSTLHLYYTVYKVQNLVRLKPQTAYFVWVFLNVLL